MAHIVDTKKIHNRLANRRGRSKMNTKSNRLKADILLKEYDICQQSAQSFEGPIFQSGGAIGFTSIAALGLLIANEDVKGPALYAAASLANFGGYVWLRMSIRWWAIQHTIYDRMHRIEKDLGISGYVTYIRRRDQAASRFQRKRALRQSYAATDADVPIDNVHRYALFGSRYYSICLITGLWLGWSALIALRTSIYSLISNPDAFLVARDVPALLAIFSTPIIWLLDILLRTLLRVRGILKTRARSTKQARVTTSP